MKRNIEGCLGIASKKNNAEAVDFFKLMFLKEKYWIGLGIVLCCCWLSGCNFSDTSEPDKEMLKTNVASSFDSIPSSPEKSLHNQTAEMEKSSFIAMDTLMDITVWGEDRQQALKEAQEIIEFYEALWSKTNTQSEIYKLNQRKEQTPIVLSSETISLIQDSKTYSQKTGGYFDITVEPFLNLWGFSTKEFKIPTPKQINLTRKAVGWQFMEVDDSQNTFSSKTENLQIDLGGVAKGFIVDQIRQRFSSLNIEGGLISLGGDVSSVGEKWDKTPWKIGISDPLASGDLLGVLSSYENLTVVTSGGYERFFTLKGQKYSHIINPLTGYPAESDLISVTIVGALGSQADAYSTALFVMGKDKACEFWRQERDFSCILVTKEKEVFVSPDLRESFTLNPSTSYTVKILSSR